MMARVGAFFSRLGHRVAPSSPKNEEIGEVVVGRTLSPELFREELADLGYDFEVFLDGTGKIWRFRRIPSKDTRLDGDVW